MRNTSHSSALLVSLLSCALVQCHDHDGRSGSTEDAPVVGEGDLQFPSPDFNLDSGRATDDAEERPDLLPPEDHHPLEPVEDAPTSDPLPPDMPVPDLPRPTDISDTGEPEGCVRRWEECLVPIPGCWMHECPELTDCSIAGCGPDVPGITHYMHGGDFCDNDWIVLGDASGRIEARDVVHSTPYGDVTFTTYLDGDPVSYCHVNGLATGAIRYQMTCNDLDGAAIHAAVLEMGPCPSCPDIDGCYEVDNADIICILLGCTDPIEEVQLRVRPGDGCRVDLRADILSTRVMSGWVSYDGVLNLGFNQYGLDPLFCTLPVSDDGFGPALCRYGHGDGAETYTIEVYLTRTGEESCELPECVIDESCQMAGVGEDCVNGECQ